MRGTARQLGRDRVPLALGVAAVGLMTAALDNLQERGGTPVIGMLLLPVVVVAVFTGGLATAVVAATAVLGTVLIWSRMPDAGLDTTMRFWTIVAISALVTLLSELRQRRERSVTGQVLALETARQETEAERLRSRLLERLPELSGAASVDDVTERACRVGREVFGADAVSWYRVEGDMVVLASRSPEPPWPLPLRFSADQMHRLSTLSPGGAAERSTWTRASDLSPDDPRRRQMEELGCAVAATTPVRVELAPVGYLALGWHDDRPDLTTAELQALDRFADQVALAKTVVRRTAAQRESRDLTDRLQASFLPSLVDHVPGADVALLYRPGTAQLLLGGDFVDVTGTADGSTCFLIGDVSGHGPEQAALAAVLRAAWRGAVSVPGSTLAQWLVALESVVRDRRPSPGLFVTLVTGCMDSGMTSVEYVCAGHPPPVLLPEGRELQGCGPPLGILDAPLDLEPRKVALPAGSAVLVLTDGLFEGRLEPGSSERLGLDRLLEMLPDAGEICAPGWLDGLADRLEHLNGGPLPDDAAALLLRARPEPV